MNKELIMRRNEWEATFKQYSNTVEEMRKTFEQHIHSGATVHKFNNHLGLIYYALHILEEEYKDCGEELSDKFYERHRKFLDRLNECATWLGSLQ